MLLWFVSSAAAGSLDLLEVGGAWGTPAATNPSALWWNPAGLAVRGGTQLLVEGAPTFGGLSVDRANPDYGELTPFDGFSSTYDYGGTERFSSLAVVPFLGVSSDLGLEGLGLGLGLYVPTGKAAKTDQESGGPNRYTAREGNIRAVHVSLGASYRIRELLSLGLSASVVDSAFYVSSDASMLPDLAWTVQRVAGLDELPGWYEDGRIEDPAYTSTLTIGGRDADGGHGAVHDRTTTFGGGLYLTPNDRLGISVAWNQGVRLEHEGDVTFAFQCPPEADVNGRPAAEGGGICDSTVDGTVTVAYRLPSRLHLGVAVLPVERVRLELMGAWVGWSVMDDYTVKPLVNPRDLQGDELFIGPTSQILSRERLVARGARDSFWVGVDGKVEVVEKVTVGGRITFDRAAIPTSYLNASNIDADTVILQGMGQLRPVPKIGLGLSYSYAASGARTVTDSVFSQDIARADPDSPDFYDGDGNEAIDRTYYASGNGRYALGIHRIGLSVQARFGGGTTGL